MSITVFANKSLLFRNPKTGEEAHVQAKELGKQVPDWVVNDPLYNKKKATAFGQMLHSKSIEFIHPKTKERIYYKVDPPKEFLEKLEELENE